MHDLSVVCLYTATLCSTKADGQPETRMNGGTLEGAKNSVLSKGQIALELGCCA